LSLCSQAYIKRKGLYATTAYVIVFHVSKISFLIILLELPEKNYEYVIVFDVSKISFLIILLELLGPSY
jgi:hypothetical protein